MDNRKKVEEIVHYTPEITLAGLQQRLPEVPETELNDLLAAVRSASATDPMPTADVVEQESSAPSQTAPPTPKPPKGKMKTENNTDAMPKRGRGRPAKAKTETADPKPAAKAAKQSDPPKPRQEVFAYLNQNIDAGVSQLQERFSEIKKTTLNSYLYRWRKQKNIVSPRKKGERTKKEDLSARVIEYLQEKPEAILAELRSTFPSVHVSTLKSLFSKWQKDRKPAATEAAAPRRSRTVGLPKSETDELVKALKMTITAQEKTIETMKRTIEMLMPVNEGADDPEELKELSLAEVKRIAAAYIKSLRDLPAKLKNK